MSIIDDFHELKTLIDKIGANDLSLNKVSPKFNLVSKFVLEKDGYIYRIEDARMIKLRIAFADKAEEEIGAEFYLKEELIEENDLFGISKQIKILPFSQSEAKFPLILSSINSNFDTTGDDSWERQLALRVYNDYGEETYRKISDFNRQWRVIFISQENVGISLDGKIQCFDYAANIALNQKGELVDGSETVSAI